MLLLAIAGLSGSAGAENPGECGDTRLEEKGRDAILDAIFGDGKLCPGRRRLVPVQRGRLVSRTARTFVQHWLMDAPAVRFKLERTGGKGAVDVWVCATSHKGGGVCLVTSRWVQTRPRRAWR
jgi:hypothetical protein